MNDLSDAGVRRRDEILEKMKSEVVAVVKRRKKIQRRWQISGAATFCILFLTLRGDFWDLRNNSGTPADSGSVSIKPHQVEKVSGRDSIARYETVIERTDPDIVQKYVVRSIDLPEPEIEQLTDEQIIETYGEHSDHGYVALIQGKPVLIEY